MKKKLEEKLDMEFARLDVKPYVYHFIDTYILITAITIVTFKSKQEVKAILDHIRYNMGIAAHDMLFPVSKYTVKTLHDNHIYGIALCSLQDQFNRQRGRIIAKGRLLKHLKEIRNDQ